MTKEMLIGKKFTTKRGETFIITEVEENDNLQKVVVKTHNKKMYSIYYGRKSKYIKFEDNKINKIIDKYINKINKVSSKKRIHLWANSSLKEISCSI